MELGPGSRRALARASRRVALLVACLACAGLACDAPLGEVEVGYAAPAPASAPQLDPVARDEPSAVTASPETPPRTTCLKKHEVVRPSTDDGVELVADLYTTGTTGAPAVILLHMIPPQNDRANYPAGFIEALRARGLTVLNLNRRGAAGSGGVAKEAYKGDKGWLDVKAARDLLLAHPCAPPRHRVALVGASNGTTSALDFTSHALSDAATASEAGREVTPPPASLVFLSGGRYTEAQHKLDEHAALTRTPILFAAPKEEIAWSRGATRRNKRARWTLYTSPRQGHGTALLRSDPRCVSKIVEHLARTLLREGASEPGATP
ncbi:MAG: hypothetical protein H6713_38920 [Myxococcales bacterium]|nr:hypothetical protein [Myxococcales bacterium]